MLGPILFIAINSLLKLETGGTIISYADDTVLFYSGHNWEIVKTKVEHGVTMVKKWLDVYKLSLNLDKTNYIAFSINSVNRPDFSFVNITNLNATIKEVSTTKYLGIVIDKHLKWEHHASRLKNNLRKLIHKFYTLREILTRQLLTMIYRALVESLIRYGIVIWGGLYNKAIKQLNVVQNYILKVINKKEKRYPTQRLYNLEIFNVRSLYVLSVCSYVHKVENFKLYVNHNHETRNRNRLQVPRNNRNISHRFVNYLGPTFYNMLPVGVRVIKNLKHFNLECRKYIHENNALFINKLQT